MDCGGWWLDVARRTAGTKTKSVELTKNEWNILFYLAGRTGERWCHGMR